MRPTLLPPDSTLPMARQTKALHQENQFYDTFGAPGYVRSYRWITAISDWLHPTQRRTSLGFKPSAPKKKPAARWGEAG